MFWDWDGGVGDSIGTVVTVDYYTLECFRVKQSAVRFTRFVCSGFILKLNIYIYIYNVQNMD